MANTFSDRIRRLYERQVPKFTTYGLSNHDVYKVVETWAGDSRRRGGSTPVKTLITPRPEYNIMNSRKIASSGGRYQEGDVELFLPLEWTVGSDSGGFAISDFQPSTNHLQELYFEIDSKKWEIVEGPTQLEDLFEMRFIIRQRKQ